MIQKIPVSIMYIYPEFSGLRSLILFIKTEKKRTPLYYIGLNRLSAWPMPLVLGDCLRCFVEWNSVAIQGIVYCTEGSYMYISGHSRSKITGGHDLRDWWRTYVSITISSYYVTEHRSIINGAWGQRVLWFFQEQPTTVCNIWELSLLLTVVLNLGGYVILYVEPRIKLYHADRHSRWFSTWELEIGLN